MTIRTTLAVTAFAATLGLAALVPPAAAQPGTAPTVTASQAWVRWLPNDLPAAGYVTLTNQGNAPIDVKEASSADYGSVMLHQTVSSGSTSQMVMVDKATIPAHGSLQIAPGGYHFMLEEPTRKIKPGDTVHLRLKFSDGTTLDTPFPVRRPGQTQ